MVERRASVLLDKGHSVPDSMTLESQGPIALKKTGLEPISPI